MAEQGGYFSPGYEYSGQLSKIERRKALAKAMQAQSMEPLQGGSAGGYTIPIHPLQGIAKLAQAWAGEKTAQKAETEQADLAKQSQGAYQQMLAKALGQMKADPQGAMATLSTHPQGAALLPLAMQEYQRQQWAKSIMPQGQSPEQATLMMGKGPIPVQPGAGGGQQGPDLSNPAAWITAPEGGRQYLEHTSRQKEALGGVQYDQQGKAFVITKGGGVQYLPGIMARDKMEMVGAGDRVVPVNPYQQNQPIPMGMSPADQMRIPAQIQNDQFSQAAKTAELRDQGINLPRMPAPPRPGFAQQPVPPMPGQSPVPVPQGPARPQGAPAALPVPPEVKGVPQQPPVQGKPITPFSPPTRGMSPKQERELAAEREAARPQQTQAANSSIGALNDSIAEVDRLLNQPGLPNITGPIAGRTPNLTGKATDAQANLDTLQSQIGVRVLTAMREASKTGGAVGNVTEKEWPILQNQFGALQQPQTTGEFKKNLATVRATLERTKNSINQAYKMMYGEGPPSATTDPTEESIMQEYRRGGKTPQWLEDQLYQLYRKK